MKRLFAVAALLTLRLSGDTVAFNRDIRAILSDRCFACHGPDPGNRKAGLRLDLESAAKAARGSRFAIVAGKPTESEIYRRVTSANKALRMPPAYGGHDALPEREIELLRRWIEEGAKYEPHWSFIPPKKAPRPAVIDARWPSAELDYFVLSRIERESLKPSPEADRRTLIRRATLDLTGLPPFPQEVESFVNDRSPEAFEKVVDRLLASPRYAERMAIRWLEAARYADTNGYQTDGPRTMWPWRDWVIDAFHRDMPYDRFTVAQLAGDLLPSATRADRIATAFNRNHRTSAEGGIVDEEFRVEYVADRAETAATVWLGLTVGCARCHDHKFDPITQKDYYSLFAFFNNVPERGFVWNFGNEEPVIKAPSPEQQTKLAQLDSEVERARLRLAGLDDTVRKAQASWEREIGDRKLDWNLSEGLKLHLALDETGTGVEGCGKPPCRLSTVPGMAGGGTRFDGTAFLNAGLEGPKFNYLDPFTISAWVKPESPTGAIVSRGEDYDEGQQHGLYLMDGKLRLHVIFRWTDLGLRVETVQPLAIGRWQHVAVSYDGGMRAAGVRMYVDGKLQPMTTLFDQALWPIDTSKEPWRVGAGGGLRFRGAIDDVRIYDRVVPPEDAAVLPVLDSVDAIARLAPASRTEAQRRKLRLSFLDKAAPAEVREAQAKLDAARSERAMFLKTIPTVMVMEESPERRPTFLLKRGAYDAPGEKVEPRIPEFLPAFDADWPVDRLGLAKWIVDRRNPLTARAAVNRFWAMLFGSGLVRSVEDFGSQGEWPANQDLLDWLAVDFMDSGWSVKRLMKTMVLSSTYRQSSKVSPALLQRDPENRLLARGPRFRLSAEMIRDQALAASGLLVERIGGPPVRPYQPAGLWQELQGGQGYKEDEGEGLYRRSLYSYWRRTVAPPNMAVFDSPTRETCTVRENRTNTPLQALDLMNDVVYLEAARKLAERMIDHGKDSAGRLDYGYRLVVSRPPLPQEQTTLLNALQKFAAYYDAAPQAAESFVRTGKSARKEGVPAAELAAYSAVAGILLNLDEAVTKQ